MRLRLVAASESDSYIAGPGVDGEDARTPCSLYVPVSIATEQAIADFRSDGCMGWSVLKVDSAQAVVGRLTHAHFVRG